MVKVPLKLSSDHGRKLKKKKHWHEVGLGPRGSLGEVRGPCLDRSHWNIPSALKNKKIGNW